MPEPTVQSTQETIDEVRKLLPSLTPDERRETEELIANLLQLEKELAEGTEELISLVKKEKASLTAEAEANDRTPALSAIDSQLAQF